MKYFSIGVSRDLKIIGHYPQTDFKNTYNPNLPNSHWQVKPYQFPDFSPNYELELHKNAIPSNLIEGVGGYNGMLIDSKFKEILKDFNLPPHKFYKIKVFHKGKLLNYYWFHYIVPNLWKYIDIDNSTICIKHFSNFNNNIVLPILDLEHLKKLIKLSRSKFTSNFEYNIIPEKIIFNNSFKKYDIIEINHLYPNPLISYKLKKVLEENNITGFNTKLFRPLIIQN